ncbi:MAG: Gfo/Idh/MocA family oxidoreductase [Candidatus Altiarchaeota archaeon]
MGKLNAAVIGVGSMGKNHARIYFESDEVNLVAVADSDRKQAASVGEKYGCNFYEDYKQMLPSEKIDLLSVVVPTQYHKRVAFDCLDSGIDILIEKPIAHTIKDAEAIIGKAKKTGRKVMVGHIERFNPAVWELKKRLDRKELGRIFKISTQRVGPFPARIRDVGVVIDLATHDIDIIRYLTGSEVMRLYAEAERKIHTKHEDLLDGVLKFRNNVIGILSVNWLTPEKIREISIVGEKGMFTAKYLTQELLFYENVDAVRRGYEYSDILMGVSEGDITSIRINKQEPLRVELNYFIDSVRKDKPVPITPEDGLESLRIATKLIESSKKNKVIRL